MSTNPDSSFSPRQRPRRLRANPAVRDLVQETFLRPGDLIQPLFLLDQADGLEPIASMPGINRMGEKELLLEAEALLKSGIRAVALFPCITAELKTDDGRQAALDPEGLICRRTRLLKEKFPGLVIIADIALDPYTSHGHDGVVDASTGEVLNDPTVAILAEMAVVQAAAGVDWVAPSDMMDGRVGAIRQALDLAGFTATAILAYSAKFASAYYGPFREAVGSGSSSGKGYLDKRSYQLNPANPREARREVLLDIGENADLIMVKPAGPYLDIIRQTREATDLPVVAYQVSGEYAQIVAAAERGWLDRTATRDESLLAIKRAGADLILTYFAREWASSYGNH